VSVQSRSTKEGGEVPASAGEGFVDYGRRADKPRVAILRLQLERM